MLGSNRPPAVGVAAIRIFDIAEAELEFATRVSVDAADIEVVSVCVILLEDIVFPGEGVAIFKPPELYILNARTGTALIPVVKVGNMDAVTFVKPSTCPK
ncbi:hypothetical protein D3C80_1820310 [compost metagenome]